MNDLAGKTEKIDWNNCNPNTTQTTRKRPFLKRMGSLGGMVLTSMSDRRKKFLWKAQSWKNRFSCTSSGDGVAKRVLFGEIMKASSKVYTESGRQTELFHDLSGSRCAMRGKLKEDSSQPSLAPPVQRLLHLFKPSSITCNASVSLTHYLSFLRSQLATPSKVYLKSPALPHCHHAHPSPGQ